MSQAKDLVEIFAKSLVEDASKVNVIEVEGEHTVVIELRVGPQDIGKVIGKQGRIAKALRMLVSAMGRKSGKKYMLEIIE
jgi:RNA-binding protein (KH domain)